ncbi:MAG: NACHT domain-containing protein [Tissierellales bacterium]|nr:NACHT domain-containing protein [Tissierellales bacterium]
MNTSKLSRLASIKDEVKEFHPLLEKLLKKIPGVVDVEYTHGSDEMGADFVLSKKNEPFGYLEHIGVIAKVGKVVQDYADIERQISECEVPRFFFGGKEKIRISEVWIAITEHITKGAKEKIYEKYKGRKITFIDGKRLENLIDKYVPNFWTELTLEVGDYLTEIRRTCIELDQNTNLLPLIDGDFYIEPDICEVEAFEYNPKSKYLKRRTNKIDIKEKIAEHKLILLEGGMGSGKTKLLRHLTQYFATPHVYLDKKRIPIYVTYKDILDKYNCDIEKLINDQLGKKLLNEVNELNCLILIDAVDEKDISTEEHAKNLQTILQNIEQLDYVAAIMTSRNFEEFNLDINLSKEILKCELKPLSFNKTIEFLTKICSLLNITTRIIEDLKRSQLFKELPKSPISAILLAKLLKDNPEDIPSNMTELYTKFVELSLGRWDINKGLQSQKEYEALDHIMMQIAEYMLTNEIPCIAIDEAKKFFKSYLDVRNLDIDSDKLFEKVCKRCELISINQKSYAFSFKHRTFAEYLYAQKYSDGRRLEIDEKAFEPYWKNTYFFYLGILKDCPEILEQIYSLEPNSETKRWLKIANLSSYMLAAYTSPYDIITEGITRIMKEAAKLYIDIVERRIDSFLVGWPRMYIFYFLQYLIRHNYSYSFFTNAMEIAALSIDEAKMDEFEKVYAIFLLNVAYLDAASLESFDFLLENRIGKLPIDISLSLKHQTDNFKTRNALLKKQEKHLKKSIQGNKPLIAQIDKMYEKPLKSLIETK